MPIRYQVEHDRRLVIAEGYGAFGPQDIFQYQHEVWSRAELLGYDEIVDMTLVESIESPSSERMRKLAELSASMDAPGSGGKLAIVAPQDLAFGFGRMYESYRELNQKSTKQVAVFRDRVAAVEWIEQGADAESPAESNPGGSTAPP